MSEAMTFQCGGCSKTYKWKPELAGKRFYEPTTRGHEAIIADRLAKWRKLLAERGRQENGIEWRKGGRSG